MPFQFSKVEWEKLHTSWLAWKDIRALEFLKAFRPLWKLTIKNVEALLKQSNCNWRLQDVGKVGLTIQPNVSFAFSAIPKAYFLNVWSFFFCLMESESSIFFRPTFLFANELVHEYAHCMFWRDHGILDKDKKAMEQFESEHGLENEKNALTKEVNFLKKVRYVIPGRVRIKLFRVQSWTRNGTPNCEGKLLQLENRKNIKSMIKLLEREIQELSSKKSYDNMMSKQKIETHTALSSILKLNVAREVWPIIEMET